MGFGWALHEMVARIENFSHSHVEKKKHIEVIIDYESEEEEKQFPKITPRKRQALDRECKNKKRRCTFC